MKANLDLSSVQVLSLKPNDILIVKHGDRATGWIPADDKTAEFEDKLRGLLDSAGLSDVKVLSHHYGIDFTQISSATTT